MKPIRKSIFLFATTIFLVLLIPSFFAAFAEDEGTLPEGSFWRIFTWLFQMLRFPTHTLIYPWMSGDGGIFFLGGLILNCLFYGLIVERLVSYFRWPSKRRDPPH